MIYMNSAFDPFAEGYDAANPALPQEYVHLIGETFAIRQSDRVIDLGCGSGALALALARLSKIVEGLDLSERLLAIARKRDQEKRVSWIYCPVESFQFERAQYKLIVSFESFHLFGQHALVIRNCAAGLRDGGFLAVGWCVFHWEPLLKDVIVRTFESFGIMWGEWGYQAVPWFAKLIEDSDAGLTGVETRMIPIWQENDIVSIAQYLAHIDKTAHLIPEERRNLCEELVVRFRAQLGTNVSSGVSQYYVAYSTKKQLR